MKKITQKSNIKSKKFYKEANEIRDGWGETLRKVDVLRDKFDRNERINLKEACYILWVEKFINSDVYLEFQKEMKVQKMDEDNLPWPAWYGMFENWQKSKS